MRYAARKDANHTRIMDVFRTLLADHVTDSSGWGEGAGDLFVSFGRYSCFVELKRDERANLTAAQIKFRNKHPGVYFRCEDEQQAERLCKYIRHQAEKLG